MKKQSKAAEVLLRGEWIISSHSKRQIFLTLAMGLLLFIQIAMLAYFNLRDIRNSLDYDFANTIYHYREVIKNGTLDLKGWHHTTSLELDAAFLFALPLYYITHDIFTAVGIANMIYVFLYMAVAAGILKCANVGRNFIYAALALILIPYSFGMLEYFNMMFYGGSCYALKALVPLMCIWLILLFGKESVLRNERVLRRAALCAYLFFLIITSFSTGIYVTLCGLLPIFAAVLFDIWKSGARYNRNHVFLLIGSVIAFLAGNAAHNKFYGLVSRNNLRLTKIENYEINFNACIRGIFDVFGATVSEDIEAMSPLGIFYCLKMAFVAALVIVWLYNVWKLFGKSGNGINVKTFLTIIPLFNFLLLLIADSRYSTNTRMEYRYYLIGAAPMILLFGMQLEEWGKSLNKFQRYTAAAALIACLAALMLGNNKMIIDKWDRTSYAVELCEYFNALDVETVFFVDDPDTADICRGIDEKRKYGTFLSETQKLKAGPSNYEEAGSGSFYSGKNAMAVFIYTVPSDYMPEEITQHYEKVGTVRWFDIYVSDMVWFP